MTWPPTNNFDNFITKLLSGSLPNYDPKDLEANNSENTRYAGHCLLWSKTNLVFKTRKKDVPMRALFMVSSMFVGTFYMHYNFKISIFEFFVSLFLISKLRFLDAVEI